MHAFQKGYNVGYAKEATVDVILKWSECLSY